LILFISLTITGCFSAREAEKTVLKKNTEKSNSISLKEGNITNYDFSVQKAEIELDINGEKQRFLASVKYEETGIYLVSLKSRSGIEAVRFYKDGDSVLINDRINKKYYYNSIENFPARYKTFLIALPLLFGDFIRNDENRFLNQCKNGIIEYVEQEYYIKTRYIIDCNLEKLKIAEVYSENEQDKIIFNYKKFANHGKVYYPEQIVIESKFNEMIIKINIDDIEFIETEGIKLIPGRNFEKVILK